MSDSTEGIDDLVERLGKRRLVVVSNREPVVHSKRNGRVVESAPAGGLRTALEPLVGRFRATWVAHGSGDADFDVTDDRGRVEVRDLHGRPFQLRRVRLPADIAHGYYDGFSNEGLWPLCHIAYTEPVFRASDWRAYVEANRIFASTILEEVGHDPALVLINDYHLALVPQMLRAERNDLLLAHFWHVPWPTPEVMGICPYTPSILEGLLGNDLIGFHIQYHCNNFLNNVNTGLEAVVNWENHTAQRKGHRTVVRPFPISIDTRELPPSEPGDLARDFPELAQKLEGKSLLLGVDRLDYTKGIPHRLRILDAILERNPDLIGKLVFVQIGAPSRDALARYKELATEVAALVASINERYARGDWRPIEYMNENVERARAATLMRHADALFVTSLHDGMNLVAKEYVVARDGKPGTLVLSRFAGASRELAEACLVNPYDADGSAALVLASLRLPEARRAEAMTRMLERVRENDIYKWTRDILLSADEIARAKEARQFPGNL